MFERVRGWWRGRGEALPQSLPLQVQMPPRLLAGTQPLFGDVDSLLQILTLLLQRHRVNVAWEGQEIGDTAALCANR
jgi:hypothetical protein